MFILLSINWGQMFRVARAPPRCLALAEYKLAAIGAPHLSVRCVRSLLADTVHGLLIPSYLILDLRLQGHMLMGIAQPRDPLDALLSDGPGPTPQQPVPAVPQPPADPFQSRILRQVPSSAGA